MSTFCNGFFWLYNFFLWPKAMQTLRDLILASKANPAYLKQLENSIQSLSANIFEYHTLTALFQDTIFECKFYGTICLQKRLKYVYKSNDSNSITAFINFVNFAFEESSKNQILSNKMADIYALTIIYYYPVHNSNIFDLISTAVCTNLPIGYLILQKFLFILNTSSEISNDRRVELKKLTKDQIKNLLFIILSKNAEIRNSILIFNNSLTFIKDLHRAMFDYVILNGRLHTNEALDFFSDYICLFPSEDTTNQIISFFLSVNDDHCNIKIIEIFLQANKETYKNTTLLDFVLFCYEKEDFFEVCFEFFVRFFKSVKDTEKYANFAFSVLNKTIIKIQNAIQAEAINESNNNRKQEDLIRLISSKFTQVSLHLLSNFSNEIPVNVLLILLERSSLKKDFVFPNEFLNCYSEFKRNDAKCVRYLQMIDLKNKESVKFASKILKRFLVDETVVHYILNSIQAQNKTDDCLDDLMITCISILIKNDAKKENSCIDVVSYLSTTNDFDWNRGRKKRFLCFLKKDVKILENYFQSFFTYFLNQKAENTEFNECEFAILSAIQKNFAPLPQEILIKIFNDLKFYKTKDICVILNELLPYLNEDVAKAFIEYVFNRIAVDFEEQDHAETIGAIRSFLNFAERQIIKEINKLHISEMTHEPQNINVNTSIENNNYILFYTNMLVESLNIKELSMPRRIHEILQKHNLKYNENNAIYKLLILYNTSEMTDAQNDILAFLIYLISKTEDLSVLKLIPQSTEETIENLKIGLSHGTTKNKKDVLREFLKEVKGKPMHEMFRDSVVVEKLGLGMGKKDTTQADVNISDFFK